ncbi:hypothetical protein [Pontibacter sp. SGAir0037]|uniref:hypothetical protein n=1 Tax=Pontibacter sp. SGAir0037 TaxID=2571030 RepID=UPI0010CCE185|nr:hypothetical protein [Pontibacter sp. SGAir0037]QCR24755.1 hypothetical protein C1N53_21955 [Pontibacter sp. SGAir0037]
MAGRKNYPLVLTPQERLELIKAITSRRYAGWEHLTVTTEEEDVILDNLLKRLGINIELNKQQSGSGVWILDVVDVINSKD